MSRIDNSAIARLKSVALTGDDKDIRDDADKRTRARILPNLTVSEGQTVRIDGTLEVTVLAPGRGKNTVLCAWLDTIDGRSTECIGTFFEHQVR